MAHTAAKKRSGRPRPVLHGIFLAAAALLLAGCVALHQLAGSFSAMLDLAAGGAVVQVQEQDLQAVDAAAGALALRAEAESAVLVQNNGTLPLSAEIRRVNVFGWASTQWLGGGSGSGGVSAVTADFLAALEAYGIQYNPDLAAMYRSFQDGREYTSTLNSWPEQSCRLYEPDIRDTDYYTETLLADALAFSDTAIVVIGRLAGESNDCTLQQYKRLKAGGDIVVDASRGYLELSAEELALLAYVGAHYENVIVLLNTGNVMALGALETIPGIDACLLAGYTGQAAAQAIPLLLWGEANPCGRTADTWAYDFATAASYANAGQNGVGAYTGAEGLYPADGTTCGNLGQAEPYTQVSYVDYAEGIYVGYKWYETADAEGFWDGVSNQYGAGYAGVVQYPFGYGLSYTQFSWTVVDAPAAGSALAADGEVSLTVEVTNTGSAAGRDVVQLYYTAPYTPGGIEKSVLELAAFAKTDLLLPGQSQRLTLTVSVRNMASYDCFDANGNGFAGYELDAGEYVVTLRRDAHTVAEGGQTAIPLVLAQPVQYPTDAATGSPVGNKFTGADALDGVGVDGSDTGQNIVYLTRADFAGTFPAVQAEKSRPMPEAVAARNLYTPQMAEAWADPAAPAVTTGAENGLCIEQNGRITPLGEALGADYSDPRWEALLDQLTQQELLELVTHAYSHTAALPSVGKPQTKEADGPSQIGGFIGFNVGTGFSSSSTLAQSWDVQLAEEVGCMIGRQAAQRGYSGWYAPAVNLHRSPLDGRNYEYYSEDALLSGWMCGSTAAGSLNAGVYCFVKHFICNDQESYIYRDGIYTWMTEQTLREIYLEPFRLLVEEYGVTGLMSSYNRIGAVWAGGSAALLTGVLREEWGFTGAVITDYSDHHAYMNGDQMLRAGGDLWMDGVGGALVCETASNSFWQALRRAAKNVLYLYLNARVRNQAYAAAAGEEMLRPVITWRTPLWRLALAGLDLLAALAFAWALWALLRDLRQKHAAPKRTL